MLTKMKVCFFLLILGCMGCQPMVIAPSIVVCEPSDDRVVLDKDWLFRLDEADIGLTQHWENPDASTDEWTAISVGQAWETQGFAYDGVAWYQRKISIAEPLLLFLADVDDSATIWVNGTLHTELDAQTTMTLIPLTESENTIVLRVVDTGGYGGIKSVPQVGKSPESAVDEAHYATYFAQQNLEIPYPQWTQGEPLAWTMIGGLNAKNEGLVSIDGAMAPYADAPTTELWLYNSSENKIYSASQRDATFSLIGDVPIPQWEWQVGDIRVRQAFFFDETDQAVRSRIWVVGDDSPNWQLWVVTRNLGVNKSVRPVYTIGIYPNESQDTSVWVNNKPFLVVNREPQMTAWGNSLTLLTTRLTQGQWQKDDDGCDPSGNMGSVLVYDVPAQQEIVMDMAMVANFGDSLPTMQVDSGKRLEEARVFWQEQTNPQLIRVPDNRIQASLSASLGYLLLATDPDGPHPGPLAHDAIWTRDAAYMGLAMLMAGKSELAKQYVERVLEGQSADGKIAPIQGAKIPWTNNEWDAQGQAIFLAVVYYRYTQDIDTLNKWYPQLQKAADYILKLRNDSLNQTIPALQGLLPLSLSAEDLGEGEQHYYWDNFWALAGLEEFVFASQILNKTTEVSYYQAEADGYRQAILASIETVMGDPPPYIPASVETLENSGMARGSVPTLFPYGVFSSDDALIRRSFDTYHTRWIEPYAGGYLHREGQYWTYGGIELAHAYLRLGRGDILHQILGWTLEHQTLPNTYAWAEQVSPYNFGFTGGDMPHAWMSASYFTLIREMLVLEENARILLFKGASGAWFLSGQVVELRDLPTHFGKLTLKTTSTISDENGVWAGELHLELSGVTPPEGFFWGLGQKPSRVEGAIFENGVLKIDPTHTQVTLFFERGD